MRPEICQRMCGGWPRTSFSAMKKANFAARMSKPPIIMADQDNNEFALELSQLQQEHRDLDAAIEALHHSPAPDLLQLQRLKKRKLQLRDRISFLEDQITPDIIACPPAAAAKTSPRGSLEALTMMPTSPQSGCRVGSPSCNPCLSSLF